MFQGCMRQLEALLVMLCHTSDTHAHADTQHTGCHLWSWFADRAHLQAPDEPRVLGHVVGGVVWEGAAPP
jgi:hypothetical protein